MFENFKKNKQFGDKIKSVCNLIREKNPWPLCNYSLSKI